MKRKNVKNKLLISSIIFIVLIEINVITNAKYIFEYSFKVANVNIDLTKPEIEIISIENNNEGYEKYANKTHEIKIKLKVVQKNIDIGYDKIEPREIEVKVGEAQKIPAKRIVETERNNDEIYYEISLSSIQGNGNLEITLIEGTIKNSKNIESDAKTIDTQITIDNIEPVITYDTYMVDKDTIGVKVNTSEPARDVEGWETSESNTEFRKAFKGNAACRLEIADYAQNIATFEIVIQSAKNAENKIDTRNSQSVWMFNSIGVPNYI